MHNVLCYNGSHDNIGNVTNDYHNISSTRRRDTYIMATIQMSAQQVIDAAIKTIASIEDTRKKRDEDSIASVMAVSRGWFKKYHYTREQAIIWLGKQDVWGWHSMYAWGDLEKAKALLKLAEHGDPVTLNEEDVGVLF